MASYELLYLAKNTPTDLVMAIYESLSDHFDRRLGGPRSRCRSPRPAETRFIDSSMNIRCSTCDGSMGIAGVQTQHSTWSYRPAATHEQGAQIDLLIDRKDGVINLCEMKFSDTAYEISKKYAGELRTKEEVFRRVTGTRKTVFVTIVSPYGVKPNQQAQTLIQGVVTADHLYDG